MPLASHRHLKAASEEAQQEERIASQTQGADHLEARIGLAEAEGREVGRS